MVCVANEGTVQCTVYSVQCTVVQYSAAEKCQQPTARLKCIK